MISGLTGGVGFFTIEHNSRVDVRPKTQPLHGRGSASNPANRFGRIEVEPDPDVDPEEQGRPETLFLRDTARSIITTNTSPDVGFEASINPYRGCEHGCSYCYARPFHDYLGFSSGLEFETRILVKEDAPALLRRELTAPSWQPKALALSGVTDPYQPIERRLKLTRGCLEVLAELRHPTLVVTKNHLVTRDVDLLAELARFDAVAVAISVTTLDPELARRLEPRASHPRRRLEAVEKLVAAGVPAVVLMAPIIPAITDHEIPRVLEAAAKAGASYASHVMLRLPHAVSEVFSEWLEHHFPERKEKVLGRVREMRGGQLNDARFGTRMRGEGAYAQQISQLFKLTLKRVGLADRHWPEVSSAAFRKPGEQLGLFG